MANFWKGRSGSAPQTIDSQYLNLVWSLLVLQPDVIVGTVPDGAIDVFIAPNRQASKAGASKVPELEGEDGLSSQLMPIEKSELENLTQAELITKYGNKLRIAVNPELALSTISGFHIRVRIVCRPWVMSHYFVQPSKLSPMVYTCLQLVTRGRDDGISVVDLGSKTGYDQKACFYLVKQLLELDLV